MFAIGVVDLEVVVNGGQHRVDLLVAVRNRDGHHNALGNLGDGGADVALAVLDADEQTVTGRIHHDIVPLGLDEGVAIVEGDDAVLVCHFIFLSAHVSLPDSVANPTPSIMP